MEHTEFLIVGAGPYSLSVAAYAKQRGADVTLVGKPLDFWKTNMPRGMFLRSGPDWHLDGREVYTFEAFLKLRGSSFAQAKPIPRDTFLDYASWFMGQYGLRPHPELVTRLERSDGGYIASLSDGARIHANKVMLGLGFALFKHAPEDIVKKLPAGSFSHTCDTVDFEFFRNRRVLIVGGRQSAFEWAALMSERGAEQVHLAYRHLTPRFTEPDWSWVQPMARRTVEDHGWWRRLGAEAQEQIRRDFWAAGRLILEAWLDARVHQANIQLHEKTGLREVARRGDGSLDISLDDGTAFNVEHVLLATGYRPNMHRAAFLDRATILEPLSIVDGYPALDTEFQTNLPGLYITGLAATNDFGPFFGFTVACPVAAQVIGEAVTT